MSKKGYSICTILRFLKKIFSWGPFDNISSRGVDFTRQISTCPNPLPPPGFSDFPTTIKYAPLPLPARLYFAPLLTLRIFKFQYRFIHTYSRVLNNCRSTFINLYNFFKRLFYYLILHIFIIITDVRPEVSISEQVEVPLILLYI